MATTDRSLRTARSPDRARRPIRVLLAAPSLDILGGQSRQAVRLMDGLAACPDDIAVHFVPHNPRLPRAVRWLQSIKLVRTVVTTLYYWLLLLRRVPRADVVHVFSASYYSYLLSAAPALAIARLFGRKSILNYRSGEADDHLANWKRTAIPTIRWADVIVVPSRYLVDVFARYDLPARAIYDIIELDRFRYRERTAPSPVFATSRLLEPLYNVPCVLRAFARIQARYPEARLTVAGEGYLRPELESLARELKLRNTEFIGRVPFEAMPDFYDSADVYLTATSLDNMPGSITESLVAGLPVVSTNAGGIPYIVTHEETALLVDIDDDAALAEAAIRLLEEPGLAARLSRNGREQCRKFTWEAVRDSWIALYREMIEERIAASAADARAASTLRAGRSHEASA